MKKSLDIAAIVLTSLLLLGFALLSVRGLIDPHRLKPVRHASVRTPRRLVFIGLSVPQSVIVVLGAVYCCAGMDAAGPSPDHNRGPAVFDMSVLSLGGVTDRISSGRARAHCDHGHAALAAGARKT